MVGNGEQKLISPFSKVTLSLTLQNSHDKTDVVRHQGSHSLTLFLRPLPHCTSFFRAPDAILRQHQIADLGHAEIAFQKFADPCDLGFSSGGM